MMRLRWKIRTGPAGRERDPAAGGTRRGRAIATLFFGFFLALGLALVYWIARETWRCAETYGWAERRCEILRSEVVRRDGENPYRPEVGYRTRDAGETITGSRIQRRGLAYDSWGDAAERLAPYPVGATAPCYVSAAGESVLERGPLWIGLWMLLPLLFVAIGAGGVVACWWPGRRDRLGRALPKALGDGRRRPGAVLMGLGLLFTLLGGGVLWPLGVLPLARVYAARGWDLRTCTVEHSSVESHTSDDGTTYSVDILYRWERGRGVERSSCYSFFGGSSSGYAGKAAIVRAHPPGAEVDCWVDPERRNEAVLERGLTLHSLIALIPLAFLAAGIGMIVAGRRKACRRSRRARQASHGEIPFPPDDPILEVLPDFRIRSVPVALKAQSSRRGRLLGIVFMTIVWNGIVSVFVHQAWKGWQRGSPDWLLILFLVPFVLVGIGFCVGIIHALLALRNPRPQLLASSDTPRLGERVELQWGFTRGKQRLSRVRIVLKGSEQATYQVGTDTRTASEDFLVETVVDLPATLCHAGGHASFSLPADSMHSFESAHNKIQWKLEVHGEIRRWADVKEVYPLVVLPQSAGSAKWEGERR